MLKSHIKSLVDLLNHGSHLSRLGAVNVRTKEFSEEFAEGTDAILNFVSRYNGDRNCFIGRNPVANTGNVAGISAFSLDIDPVRAKDTPSTDEQHTEALETGRKIIQHVGCGYLASSGNGALVIWPFGHTRKEFPIAKSVNTYFKRRFETPRIKVDNTYDDARLIKLIGTRDTKGSGRISKFITPVMPPFKDCCVIENFTDTALFDSTARRNEPGWIKEVLEELPLGRTPRLVRLVGRFKYDGWQPEETYKILEPHAKSVDYDLDKLKRLIEDLYGRYKDEKKPSEISSFSLEAYLQELDNREGAAGLSLSTGFRPLDAILGEFPKGELTAFAARSGFGKTTLACTIAEHVRSKGYRVAYFSTEMHKHRIFDKLVCVARRVPLKEVAKPEHREAVRDYSRASATNPILINDHSNPTVADVKNFITKNSADLFIFDHINRVGNSRDAVAGYVQALKNFAKDINIPGIILAQLNEPPRNPKTGNEFPSLRSDIREAKDIMNEAAIYVYLSNPYIVNGPIQPVEFHVAKNRYGVSGDVIELACDKIHSRYLEA